MSPIQSFAAVAVTWQNFYVLVGTAGATLTGLMFIAVVFASGVVTPETSSSARGFLDPTFVDFVQVLFTASFALMPVMGPRLLGGLLVATGALRVVSLRRVYRQMNDLHRRNRDVELSDWVTGMVVPSICHALLVATGIAFFLGLSMAWSALAVVVLAVLLNGLFGAWELIVWLAITRTRRSDVADD